MNENVQETCNIYISHSSVTKDWILLGCYIVSDVWFPVFQRITMSSSSVPSNLLGLLTLECCKPHAQWHSATSAKNRIFKEHAYQKLKMLLTGIHEVLSSQLPHWIFMKLLVPPDESWDYDAKWTRTTTSAIKVKILPSFHTTLTWHNAQLIWYWIHYTPSPPFNSLK
jgi:hypothetical protein